MSKKTFNYDKEAVVELYKEIEKNGDLIDGIASKLASRHTADLDDYIAIIKSILEDVNNPPTAYELDEMVMLLPTKMYFTGQFQEALGIKEDISIALKKEVFNSAYEQSQGTVSERQATASLACQQEEIISIAYQRAYKKMKVRMDMAQEVLQSIKKVISRRMSEQHTSSTDRGGSRSE